MTTRVHVRVEGVVQGVGFRPFVHRLAGDLGLAGFVRNDARGVEIEAEGDPAAARAAARGAAHGGAAARGRRVGRGGADDAARRGGLRDRRVAARAARRRSSRRTPRRARTCLAELRDPADRRFRYPFTNCTNCGPRFTIVRGVPYDRPLTTMAGFAMCAACRAEYDDPADRRFHAQPNACPACGPRVRLVGAHAGGRDDGRGAPRVALLAGAIVAVKGIGGYHLACRADDEDAVARLRARKHREDRPFALMAADLAGARGARGARRRGRRAADVPGAADRARAAAAGARGGPRRRARRRASSASCSPTRRCTTCCWPTRARRSC